MAWIQSALYIIHLAHHPETKRENVKIAFTWPSITPVFCHHLFIWQVNATHQIGPLQWFHKKSQKTIKGTEHLSWKADSLLTEESWGTEELHVIHESSERSKKSALSDSFKRSNVKQKCNIDGSILNISSYLL